MAVKIYTTPTCPWCARTKEWLKEHRISFINVDVSADLKAQREMVDKSGQMGVPVLDIDGKIIVGYDPAAIQKALNESPKAERKKTVTKKSAPTKKNKKTAKNRRSKSRLRKP